VPRRVDHEERRRQIAEAVWRLAGRSGLEDVTLRHVASEAEVSPRLVQYYFGTREQLLLGALEILNADAEARAQERLSSVRESDLRALVRGVLLELLPLDDERRARHVVYAAYFVRFLTDTALADVARDAAPALESLLATLIRQAQELGQVSDAVRVPAEAAHLVAAAEGLQSQVLLGQRSPDDAVAVLDHQLDRIFGR
jgi:AcrR family transcriptional regulator